MPNLHRLTHSSVQWAIDESNRLGRARFLRDYGFREARDYFLIRDGQAYDSKAIAGVAYGKLTGTPISSGDFSGGLAIAGILRDLGFHVTGATDWTWPELLLACALLDKHGWHTTLRAHEEQVIELSRFLRDRSPELAISPTYRSPNSVQRKLEDIRTLHPGYSGKPTRGGRLTAEVVEAYLSDPDRVRQLAQALRDDPELVEPDPGHENEDAAAPTGDTPADLIAAMEGRVVHRLVAQRERDPKLRAAKLKSVTSGGRPIACEVCGFDFQTSYGSHGAGYIQVHHRVPLHFSGTVETKLEDLALLCANCHVMIHRGPSWKTPEELRALVRSALLP